MAGQESEHNNFNGGSPVSYPPDATHRTRPQAGKASVQAHLKLPLFWADPTPHPFLSSFCGRQPQAGSQVTTLERQGGRSAAGGCFTHRRGQRELSWMERLLSSELCGDQVLGLWMEPGACPARPSAGSTKEGPQVLGTALGGLPGLRMWLLGSGKRSILLTRMEWKQAAQS